MTPETRYRIALEIRMLRGLVTAEADWCRKQPESEQRRAASQRVAFWRLVLRDAELRLSFGGDEDLEAGVQRIIGRNVE